MCALSYELPSDKSPHTPTALLCRLQFSLPPQLSFSFCGLFVKFTPPSHHLPCWRDPQYWMSMAFSRDTFHPSPLCPHSLAPEMFQRLHARKACFFLNCPWFSLSQRRHRVCPFSDTYWGRKVRGEILARRFPRSTGRGRG